MSANDICEITSVNDEKVNEVRKSLPDPDISNKLSETFKVLGDPTRLRILLSLSVDELCVCDISALLNVTVSAVSHQLRLLRNKKLVKFRKDGKMVYYSLDDSHIKNIIDEAMDHIVE